MYVFVQTATSGTRLRTTQARCRRLDRGGFAHPRSQQSGSCDNYLRRLEGQEDKSWEKVAAAIGLSRVSLRIDSG